MKYYKVQITKQNNKIDLVEKAFYDLYKVKLGMVIFQEFNIEKEIDYLQVNSNINQEENNRLNQLENLKQLEQINKDNEILKYFKKDLKPTTKGTLLKCLNKLTYHNGNKSKVYKYHELVKKAITENLNINFSFKTIQNNLLYKWNYEGKKWMKIN